MLKHMILSIVYFTAVGNIGAGIRAEEKTCDKKTGIEKQLEDIVTAVKGGCPKEPDLEKVRTICTALANETFDTDEESNYVHLYERMIAEASCVDPKSPEEKQYEKIREMWPKIDKEVLCQNPNVSMLRYAVSYRFSSIINHAALGWKVDLNRVENGKTLLDYVISEIESNKGGTNEPILKEYRDTLIEAGAKKLAELSSKK